MLFVSSVCMNVCVCVLHICVQWAVQRAAVSDWLMDWFVVFVLPGLRESWLVKPHTCVHAQTQHKLDFLPGCWRSVLMAVLWGGKWWWGGTVEREAQKETCIEQFMLLLSIVNIDMYSWHIKLQLLKKKVSPFSQVEAVMQKERACLAHVVWMGSATTCRFCPQGKLTKVNCSSGLLFVNRVTFTVVFFFPRLCVCLA